MGCHAPTHALPDPALPDMHHSFRQIERRARVNHQPSWVRADRLCPAGLRGITVMTEQPESFLLTTNSLQKKSLSWLYRGGEYLTNLECLATAMHAQRVDLSGCRARVESNATCP